MLWHGNGENSEVGARVGIVTAAEMDQFCFFFFFFFYNFFYSVVYMCE